MAADARALEQSPPVLALLGELLQDVGLPGEAAVFLRQAQQRYPDDFWINNDLASILFEDMRPPRVDEALSLFRAALALRPSCPGTHFNLGNALLAQRDLPAAAFCYRRALEIDPKHAPAHYKLGLVSREQGDLSGALACFRRALANDLKNAAALNNLGVIFRDQGNASDAEKCFRRARQIDPKRVEAHCPGGG